jgi:murein DD-endopeptidase MepM/ murein hydrolase activator NlpD
MNFKHEIVPLLACLAAAALLTAGCLSRFAVPAPQPARIQVLVTATPPPPAAATLTPTPVPTALPTPTPTATAVPPLNPPDAEGTRGGRDFGVYRSRYDKLHAGEDWGFSRGGSSFGESVFAIGHGQVTYADPLGWGADQGVVIVRHIFQDGSTFLSFYGHLDPPSITLQPGTCVSRGEPVGAIGRPRTPPHLHFEIRSHLPISPGPGYWSTDPEEAGWLPPSQTIWNQRNAASPGVRWSLPAATDTYLGQLGDGTVVATAGNQLLGVNLEDGTQAWVFGLRSRSDGAALAADGQTIYIANQFGTLGAYRVIPSRERLNDVPPLEAIWTLELGYAGPPRLFPLPGGGLAVLSRGELFGVSPEGILQWLEADAGTLVGWLPRPDRVLLSTVEGRGLLWSLTQEEASHIPVDPVGQPWLAENQAWWLAGDGLYTLDLQRGQTEQVYPLGRSVGEGDVLPLGGGGLLIAHADLYDRRLLLFDTHGSLTWERSLGALPAGSARLVLFQERPYLLIETVDSNMGRAYLYEVDLEGDSLFLVFLGGTRSPDPGGSWMAVVGEYLLVQIGGGDLLWIDPVAAGERQRTTP